jgi:hypothetical protein
LLFVTALLVWLAAFAKKPEGHLHWFTGTWIIDLVWVQSVHSQLILGSPFLAVDCLHWQFCVWKVVGAVQLQDL